jgi:hypothetical protein
MDSLKYQPSPPRHALLFCAMRAGGLRPSSTPLNTPRNDIFAPWSENINGVHIFLLQDEEDGEQTGPAAMVPPNVPPALSGSAGRADWGPNQGAPSQRNNRENMRGTNPEVNSELRGSKGVAGGKPGTTGRWYHDMYNEDDQAPKSRQELIAYYGYDPRTRDSPPPITQVR